MENDSKWRKVSESEKEEIRNNAKLLLDKFSEKLSKIDTKEEYFKKEDGLRDESGESITDDDFRKIMFSNAPLVEEDLILAEKGGWKK